MFSLSSPVNCNNFSSVQPYTTVPMLDQYIEPAHIAHGYINHCPLNKTTTGNKGERGMMQGKGRGKWVGLGRALQN